MKKSLTLAAVLLAGVHRTPADSLELNGLTSLPEIKMAFLTLYQPAQTKPINFTLSEGEAQFGIKLVAVDAASHRVQIEQCGLKKFLRLSSAPDLTMAENPVTVAVGDGISAEEQQVIAKYLAGGGKELERLKAGNPASNPILNLFPGNGGAKSEQKSGSDSGKTADNSGSSSSGNSSSDNSGTSHDASNATGAKSDSRASTDGTKEEWYQESLTIEQNRLATVDDVLAGNATPWPRTPLTPANTPARLIGKETFFGNHIPNYIPPGYVNALADSR